MRTLWRVAFRAHPFKVRRQGLAYGLVVIENTNLFANELRDPHRKGVCLCAGPADVAEHAQGHQRISSNSANPALLARFG